MQAPHTDLGSVPWSSEKEGTARDMVPPGRMRASKRKSRPVGWIGETKGQDTEWGKDKDQARRPSQWVGALNRVGKALRCILPAPPEWLAGLAVPARLGFVVAPMR